MQQRHKLTREAIKQQRKKDNGYICSTRDDIAGIFIKRKLVPTS